MISFLQRFNRIATILFLLSLFPTLIGRERVSAVEVPSLTVETKTGVRPGDTVSVSFTVTENLGSSALEFWVKYDSSKLILTGAAAGGALSGVAGGQSAIFSPLDKTDPEPDGSVFFQWDSTSSKATEAGSVLDLTFQVKDDATDNAAIEIENAVFYDPTYQEITVTAVNGGVTISDEEIVSVDASWGSLSYTYAGETWNPQTHQYEGGSWGIDTVDGDLITVSNSGDVDVTVSFSYEKTKTEVSGSFMDGDQPMDGSTTLLVDTAQDVRLVLDGKPNQNMNGAALGTVTVTISEVK